MSIQAMLMPVFAQVALTFVLLFWMQFLRLRAVRRGLVPAYAVALREPNWPARVTRSATPTTISSRRRSCSTW